MWSALNKQMDTRPGIAAIFVLKNKFHARILFDGNMAPVEFFARSDDSEELQAQLVLNFPFVKLVKLQEFRCELDHINLFGCRSDEPAYTNSNVEDVPTERLSDNDIIRILDDAGRELFTIEHKTDEMEQEANAILSRGPLED